MDVRSAPLAVAAAVVLTAVGCTSSVDEGAPARDARVTVEDGPPGPRGDDAVLAPDRVEGHGSSGATPQVWVSRDGRTLWYPQGSDPCRELSALATVTDGEVQVVQRLRPNPDAPAACVAGDAVPVVVVHLSEPLRDGLVRVTTTP